MYLKTSFLCSFAVLRTALVCVLCSCAGFSTAREVTPLDGKWAFRFGNQSATARVSLPHPGWNQSDAAEGGAGKPDDAKSVNSPVYSRGIGTYTRKLELKPEPGKRYFLRCGGASIVSELTVNQQTAGRHEGAFTAFCYDITPFLRANGKNTLSLEVDNTHRDHIAPQRGDFSMFGGLYRTPELIETGLTCIDPLFHASPGVFLTTRELTDEKAVVEVRTLLSTAADADVPAELTVVVRDADGREVATKHAETTVKHDAPRTELPVQVEIPQPQLWQGVAAPYLYSVTVSLKTATGDRDEITQPLGLRRASIDPQKGFVLNGTEMQLRGVSRHQDMKGKGWALTPEDEARDIRLITEMGATALRTAHYPQSTHIYDLCDKAGLVVWSEVPNVNLVRDTEEFRANNRQQALEMIYQHWNHPSICLWGIFNEIYHQPEPAQQQTNQEAELTTLRAFLKQTDPSRIIVAASNQPGRKKLNTIPDHIAFNTYPGWYGGGPDRMANNLAEFIRNHPGKGVGVSEYGHGASIRMHECPVGRPTPNAPWHPEEWQSRAHEINYECIRARREVWGAFIWNMFDFASSNRCEGDSPGINDKGLVTYDRKTCKDAYFFYKANWNPKPMVYITSRRFAQRSAAEVPVKVYSNAESVELTVNGKSYGSQEPDEFCRVEWEKVTLKSGKNRIKVTARSGETSCSDSCIWTYRRNKAQADKERYEADANK